MARILIVEDMAIVALLLKDTVERMGHHVIGVACSVEDALGKIDAIRPPADAVLLDADLRGASSAPVAQRLREARIPFLIASGHDGESLDRIGTGEPRLTKPIDELKLQTALGKLLQ